MTLGQQGRNRTTVSRDHLDRLFAVFVRERTYLRNVSAKTSG
jgi:hypothetical protein